MYRLQPYYRNFNKRLVKSPKLYFYDTGLLCQLLGIREDAQVVSHPLRGAIFENHVIAEVAKAYLHHRRTPPIHFWRDRTGHEVDLLIEEAHPGSGLDHVLAMIAVGIWGAQLGNPALWVLPVTFPLVMSLGAMMGLLGFPLPGVEIGIALSALLLGAMVGREARPKLAVAGVLVGLFAIFHGHAHGAELPAGQSGMLYSMGFVIATGCLHGIGIAIGRVHRWGWGRVVLRAAGVAVAAAGVFFLWRALA